jgi:Thioredoxin-like
MRATSNVRKPLVHRSLVCLVTILVLVSAATSIFAETLNNPVEVGAVKWGRDLDQALRQSADTGKPVFLLFQEVPGCSGCQKFGQSVLSHPLMVEVIEDEFIPVLIYNNRTGGMDEKNLARFQEPSWNYQVVRFLDANARDIIPRKDRVWSLSGVALRAIKALEAANRPVPEYLKVLAVENETTQLDVCAFAVSCFWVGEYEIGKLEGVVSTEAGWLENREVTRVIYRRDILPLDVLKKKAAAVKCAQKVYAGEMEMRAYRKANESDQKKQLTRWPAIHQVTGLTPMQWTKINAFAPSGKARAANWLSPRQRAELDRRDASAMKPE